MTDRSEYVDKMKAKLDEWNADIDKMQAKAKEAQADARIEYDKQLVEMRKQRDEARRQDEGSDGGQRRRLGRHAQGFRERLGQHVDVVPESAEALYLIRSRGGAGCAATDVSA